MQDLYHQQQFPVSRRAFEEADINRDGCLDKEEFASVLMSLDPKKFSDPKTVAFQRADDDHNGELDTREVEAWLGRYLSKKAPDEVEAKGFGM
ncbi:hypothetical protein AK812_SmicGene14311 [Symbiodinium microadriaticum]|uniref:EF-hand domain-containing protein n=1 Tax=Symbiodinium microadriaticum TaxID=2951 RepID=A0A1Q9E5V4_SYMMI|nr:hypothetical protein AK812_SmicGene14311 [Symbiodinium microadriaticum]